MTVFQVFYFGRGPGLRPGPRGELIASGVFRGPLRLPPLSTDHNFYDGIFGCFTDFFLLKHQNLGIQ